MKREPALLSEPGIVEPRERRTATLATRVANSLAARVRRDIFSAPVRFVLWNGRAIAMGEPRPDGGYYDLHVRNAGTLFALLRDPANAFGDAYSRGDIDYAGDLVPVMEAVYRGWKARLDRPWALAAPWRWELWRARRRVRHHYDIGNEFYREWLDREMVYTCAYFPTADASLEEAQLAKMEYVCRKLGLRAGETVLEAGCGWGAMALYMARRHGVRVVACNVSHEQVEWARRRAEEEGLSGRVTFVEDDYRNVTGTFDAFVSIGMLEHVGRANYRDLGRRLDGWIDARHGRGLLHFIGRDRPGALNAWIRKRIFPGAYPPVLSEVSADVLEPPGLSVLDVENLRMHYARTITHWRARFEAAWPHLRARHDEAFLRAWRVYLAGSEVAFTTGYLQLFQVLFARTSADDSLRTRDGWYGERMVEPDHALV
jgi:cyclopropane-fatty-acyl-phospholipid synthase